MNPIIETIYRTRKVEDAKGGLRDAFPTSASYEAGMAMYDLIRHVKPKRTLEIGLAYGLSTLFICQAHCDNGGGEHTAIDPDEESGWGSIGLLNIQRAGLQNQLHFHCVPSQLLLPKLVEQRTNFGFILNDGAHLFDLTLLEFYYCDKLLPVGGLIMFDDLWMPSVWRVLSFVLRNRHYEFVSDHSPKPSRPPLRQTLSYLVRNLTRGRRPRRGLFDTHYGMGGHGRWCVLRKTAEDNRDWQHFASF